MRFRGAIAALVLMVAAGAEAQSLEFSGDLSLQGRWYPETPAFAGQRSSTAGLVVEPTLHGEVAHRTSFTLTAIYRYDSADSQRTHGDLREAYLLVYGDWGDNSWELRLGLDRAFWGVAEAHNLVDLVNQTDLVEHPRNRPKLGQPMARLTVSGDWGLAESFLLPYHRRRTFPGRFGRHRSGHPIDGKALYESGSEERHVDFAFRYGNAVGSLDFGLSTFVGTSREPSFLVGHRSGPCRKSIRVDPVLRADSAIRGRRATHDRAVALQGGKRFGAAARAICWDRRRITVPSSSAWNARFTRCLVPGRT